MRVGDVVIIKEDCTSPSKWKLGRVIAVHPGKDEVVRVVTLRTSNVTETKRPVVKLCHLPVIEDVPVENDYFQRGEDVAAPTIALYIATDRHSHTHTVTYNLCYFCINHFAFVKYFMI